jgi:hypothetical protein
MPTFGVEAGADGVVRLSMEVSAMAPNVWPNAANERFADRSSLYSCRRFTIDVD